MPSFAFARFRPASWFWLNDLSLNLPMSLTRATVTDAFDDALPVVAAPSAARPAQTAATAITNAQREILKMYPPVPKSTGWSLATDEDPIPMLGREAREGLAR